MQRGSGILCHISSLPSPYGIGTLGKEAYRFADFLEQSGQRYWQVLPLGPTGYGDSPYQAFSSFAGNPYLIDLRDLADRGILSDSDCASLQTDGAVDYGALFDRRFAVLRLAFQREGLSEEAQRFRSDNAYWLEGYALFMALKFAHKQKPFHAWEPELIFRVPDAMAKAYDALQTDVEFWIWLQYHFFRQWNALKEYANQKGIQIIGDIPIYVAEDSADAWEHNEVLMLGENRIPTKVAGCPPDYFAQKGQLWGNPLYDWEALKLQGYGWWIRRMDAAFSMYDMVRIDHFRAFSAFYAIPFGREDAVIGEWISGPGMDFFNTLKNRLGENLPIIAEDLGVQDDGVRNLLRDTGFPGMRVAQFGMAPGQNSEHLPHNYTRNTVAYIGTHDNDTLNGWFRKESADVQKFALSYMRAAKSNLFSGFCQSMMASPADTVIFTAQDLLNLGSAARMNTPSTLGKNWRWRLSSMDLLTDRLAEFLHTQATIYNR